jgi:hypothetical protein
MAPVATDDNAHRMNSNAASASLPAGALAKGRSARDLQAALDLQDPGGVPSVYLDDTGGHGSGLRERNGALGRLVAASRTAGRADLAALEKRVAALDGRRPTRSGTQGLAVFVGVTSGRTVEVPLPVAVAPFAAFDDLAHVRGLTDAVHRARPALR